MKKFLNFNITLSIAFLFCLSFDVLFAQTNTEPQSADSILMRGVSNYLIPSETSDTIYLVPDVWQHIAITKGANNEGKIYHNGKLVVEGEYLDKNYIWSRLDLGTVYYQGYDWWFDGWLDEIKVSDKVLTAEEIANSYLLEQSTDPYTIGLYHFNQSEGSEVNAEVGPAGSMINSLWDANGKFGDCIYFNGENAYATMPLNIPISNMTFQFWIKPNGKQQAWVVSWYSLYTSGFSISVDTVKHENSYSLELKIPTTKSPNNSQLKLPVTTRNFTDIVSAQFSVHYDLAGLEFVSVEDQALNGGTSNSLVAGQISYSWNDALVEGNTLQDGDTLVNLVFNTKGTEGGSYLVTWSDTPTKIEVGNSSFEAVPVTTIDGSVTIESPKTVSGKISYVNGDPVEAVPVNLQTDQVLQLLSTTAEGGYSLTALPGTELLIAPGDNLDQGNYHAISTLDIAIVRRHILGLSKFTDPYQAIASDVNFSSDITTLDIAIMRKVVLGIDSSFPGGKVWQPVRADQTFTTPESPFPFDSTRSITVMETVDNLDFTTIKLGDVNYSWFDDGGARLKNENRLLFEIPNVIAEDETIEIPVYGLNFDHIGGYQFTITWDQDKLEFIETVDQKLKPDYNLNVTADGMITTSWDDPDGRSRSFSDQDALFSLKFRILNRQSPADIRINSGLIPAEGFNASLEVMDIPESYAMVLFENNTEEQVKVFQNSPNPFSTTTTFQFYLPQAQQVGIKIYNPAGQLIDQMEQRFPRGTSQVEWNALERLGYAPENGLYIYRINSGGHEKTLKMMIGK